MSNLEEMVLNARTSDKRSDEVGAFLATGATLDIQTAGRFSFRYDLMTDTILAVKPGGSEMKSSEFRKFARASVGKSYDFGFTLAELDEFQAACKSYRAENDFAAIAKAKAAEHRAANPFFAGKLDTVRLELLTAVVGFELGWTTEEKARQVIAGSLRAEAASERAEREAVWAL